MRYIVNSEKNMPQSMVNTQITKGVHSIKVKSEPKVSWVMHKIWKQRINFLPLQKTHSWRIFPSNFLSFACHLIFIVSFPLAKNLLNLGIIGRYNNTFGEGNFLLTSSTSSPLSSFTL